MMFEMLPEKAPRIKYLIRSAEIPVKKFGQWNFIQRFFVLFSSRDPRPDRSGDNMTVDNFKVGASDTDF